jgi:hypothetical protein
MSEDSAVKPVNVIQVFDDELRLVRPKGLAGLRFLRQMQDTYKRMFKVAEPIEEAAKAKDDIRFQVEILSALGELVDDEFLDEVVPAFYQYSTMGLAREEALARIEQKDVSSETMAQLVEAFFFAFKFWAESDDQEALEEAQKKSAAAVAAGEGEKGPKRAKKTT